MDLHFNLSYDRSYRTDVWPIENVLCMTGLMNDRSYGLCVVRDKFRRVETISVILAFILKLFLIQQF